VLIYYIILLIVPRVQNLDYDFPVSHGLFEVPQISEGTILNSPLPPPFVSLIVLLLIVGCGIYLLVRSIGADGRRAAMISFSIFWFFILLSPTSSFVPIVDVIFEHRPYLASAGFFVILAIGLDALFLKGTRTPKG